MDDDDDDEVNVSRALSLRERLSEAVLPVFRFDAGCRASGWAETSMLWPKPLNFGGCVFGCLRFWGMCDVSLNLDGSTFRYQSPTVSVSDDRPRACSASGGVGGRSGGVGGHRPAPIDQITSKFSELDR